MPDPTHKLLEDQAARSHEGPTSHVADDAEFRAAVRAGMTSFEAGPTYDLATAEAEMRDIIHGEG